MLGSFRKLAIVECDNVFGPRQNVPYALAGRMGCRPQFQVGRGVVRPEAIPMVHTLAGKQGAVKCLLHDIAVFRHVAVIDAYNGIAAASDATATGSDADHCGNAAHALGRVCPDSEHPHTIVSPRKHPRAVFGISPTCFHSSAHAMFDGSIVSGSFYARAIFRLSPVSLRRSSATISVVSHEFHSTTNRSSLVSGGV